jgi:hypothetical protein
MPNTFAYVALYAWPLVVWGLFRVMPVPNALIWSILAGYLLLPTQAAINLPMFPSLDKASIPSLAAALMCFLYARRQEIGPVWGARRAVQRKLPTSRLTKGRPTESWTLATSRNIQVFQLLVVVLLLTPFLTVMQNRGPVVSGPTFIPGLRPYDALSMIGSTVFMVLPFLLGQRFLATTESHRALLKAFVMAAVLYSFLALFEVRMSPQLNNWVYGFFPHSWIQHLRGGGFRPLVFLPHGLALGLFLASAVLAAAALWRDASRTKAVAVHWQYATFWLLFTLVMSKNMGAMALATLLAPVALLAPRKWSLFLAAGVSMAVLAYPALRGAGWVPTELVQTIATSINEQRGGSLGYRFYNEDMLLERANEKPVAGWGQWGRSRVYDPITGDDLSVTDGLWIIRIGAAGWLGYVGMFGLLALPSVLIWRRARANAIDDVTVGLALIMAIALIDSIPNAFIGPIHWLVAGALAGRYVKFRHGASTGKHENDLRLKPTAESVT